MGDPFLPHICRKVESYVHDITFVSDVDEAQLEVHQGAIFSFF